MKLTVDQLFNMMNVFSQMEMSENKINVPTGIKIFKNQSELAKVIEPYQKMEIQIINQYSNGKGSVSPQDEGYEDCAKEMNELHSTLVEIDFQQINPEDLKDFRLTMKELQEFMPMLESEDK